MKSMKTNISLMALLACLFITCKDDYMPEPNYIDNASNTIEEEIQSIDANAISYGGDTRSFYRFNSENLNVTRWYEQGDYMIEFNQYFGLYWYNYYVVRTKRLNRLYYIPSDNNFSTVNASQMALAGIPFQTTVAWNKVNGSTVIKIGGVSQKVEDADTTMFFIVDKYNKGFLFAPEEYEPTDTTLIQDLTNQDGTKKDCFSRQVPWVRYPKGLWTGTHVWKDLTAYYWLIMLYDSTDVASIDTIHMHAKEPLASRVYLKYNGTISDSTKWDGPYAIGVDTMYAIPGNAYQDYNKRADIFISFFPGLKSNNVFHNFGFDVAWTGTDGVKHYTYEPMNQEDVRPQAKVASPGNVYRDAMGLSLDHGLQNLYEDEVVEIDKWKTQVDSTVIIRKD